MYELFLCLAITWAGCGTVHIVPFENKAECMQALKAMRFQEKGVLVTGESTTDSMAYCRPR